MTLPEKMNASKIVLSVVIFTGCLFFIGCGDPRIDLRSVKYAEPDSQLMIPADYLIGKGDELEVLYYLDPGTSLSEYLIDTEDTLRIEFYSYPALNKTARVRPDGFITLQKIGDVAAAGISPETLATKIRKAFEPHLTRPDVTVEVIDYNVKVENLKASIRTTTRGQSKRVVVRPDGQISLPYIREVFVVGLSCRDLSEIIEKRYRKYVKNISITISMLRARSNRAYIMGEVAEPNFYELPGPITLAQLIAGAGGFTDKANTHQIMHIRRGENGQPNARLIDMNNIIGKGDMSADPIIRQYDVVFVPKTKLSQAALVMESIWTLIPLRFSASYRLNELQAE